MSQVSLQTLLERGVHFGHRSKRWNPKMKPFIYTKRQHMHIIDLTQTVEQLQLAENLFIELASLDKKIVFVGTKRQAKQIIQDEAVRCGVFYVNHRWIGGLATNFNSVKKSIDTYAKLKEMFSSDTFGDYNKKELSKLHKRYERLGKTVGGLQGLDRVPDVLFVLDPNKENNAVTEANRKGISVVAICDTNCDPTQVTLPIPGNDDAIKSIEFFVKFIADAILEGKKTLPSKPLESTVDETVKEKDATTKKTDTKKTVTKKAKTTETHKKTSIPKQQKIEDLELSTRILKVLEKEKITLSHLKKMTAKEIEDIDGLGEKAAAEITAKLKNQNQ